MAEYMRNRRKSRREQLIVLKGGKCLVCGSTENLEFNHRDRESKLLTLSGKGLDGPWDKILSELDKCDLLCFEHHLEYTRGQYRGGEIRPWNDGTSKPFLHGTARTYHAGCRCDDCKLAKKLYRNKVISNKQSIPL